MYQSFVFLEIRVLIDSLHKAFCPCKAGIDSEKCPICSREAGSTPVLKETVARDAYILAHSLNCTLISSAPYEYPPNLPATPPEHPLCGASVKIAKNGWIDIEFHRNKKRIHILEIRIEEDAGRLIHADQKTYMDYATAGMPSIRIRTGNNIELGEEAEMFLIELKNRMFYTGILTEGQTNQRIRCNAYTASTKFPKKPKHYVKLRNLNSFNFVRLAINEDLWRQEALLKKGEAILSESRLWNARQEQTISYQARNFVDTVQTYIPAEPAFFSFPEEQLADIIKHTPENRHERKQRYIKSFGFSVHLAQLLCEDASIADFFDKTAALGVTPKCAAKRLLSDIVPLLKKEKKTLDASKLTPEYFVLIVKRWEEGIINHTILRLLLSEIITQDADPYTLLKKHERRKISDRKTLKTLVRTMLEQHQEEAEKLKSGVMKYLDILSGLVMKETKGLADPTVVKQLIKEVLNISIIYVLSLGGSISACIKQSKPVAGSANALSHLLDADIAGQAIKFEDIAPEGLWSEELEPADWARLIHAVCTKLASETANGIVLTHGTDTLVYTAPLIYWLFADSPVPIVLTASTTIPIESDKARQNLNEAIRLAWKKERGIYVSCNGKVLSPLNLKFIGSAEQDFVNWNMPVPRFEGEGLLTDYAESDRLVFEGLLNEAAHAMFLIKTYPGIQTDYLLAFLQKNIRIFFLELYEKGTANMKESPFSLKEFLNRGKAYRCKFYCTSQQEASVDFSHYESARLLWKQGAVPMGNLTTETAIALYYAASLVCDTAEELNALMETAALSYPFEK